ncbi:phage tail protein [uncultured Aquimarina sp.]|uniref:phage tail protein n=1 Tax=uncultured Aquimarina sp. TaxID=575652 RepID=UPI002629EF09|nr:tail fiber protein [uncultured Aquimarina sp.]
MDPFIGQIQPFGFNFAPRGWALCDGQLLPIAQNSALFSLLGTTFGGDGRTTFALPDLRGRSIVHVGNGPGLSSISWGERGGSETVTLNQLHMPSHSHTLTNGVANVEVLTTDNTDATNETDAGNNGLGTAGNMPEIFRESPTAGDKLAGVSISGTTNITGGNQGFNIRNPFLGVYVCIAMQGIFPSRS